MSAKKIIDAAIIAVGVALIAVGILDVYPNSPKWALIACGVVLMASKSVQFYLARLVRRRRELGTYGGRPKEAGTQT